MPKPNSFETKIFAQLSPKQKTAIMEIWNQEYPAQMAYADMAAFEAYLDRIGPARHLLLLNQAGQIGGWLAVFEREGDRWFAMLLNRQFQRQGLGSRLLTEAKEIEIVLNGWVADHDRDQKRDGTVYPSPLGFYRKNGFKVLPDIRFEREGLSLLKVRWEKGE